MKLIKLKSSLRIDKFEPFTLSWIGSPSGADRTKLNTLPLINPKDAYFFLSSFVQL